MFARTVYPVQFLLGQVSRSLCSSVSLSHAAVTGRACDVAAVMEKAQMSSSVLLSSDGGSRAATMLVSP
jgi:hypothetical protein